MPYITGSQGAQVNCAAVFMTTLDTALVAAGFVFVEQIVNSTVTTRVYKSPAASNFFGQDWFLIVKRNPDSATFVTFGVTEQYNSTTHLCFNYAPTNATMTPTASFAVNDAAGKSPDAASLYAYAVGISATGFTYYLSLRPDRVVIGTRVGSADIAVYAGLYDDVQNPAISPFPLVVTSMSQVSANSIGAATREPGVTVSTTNCFAVGVATSSRSMYVYSSTPSPESISGQYWLSRLLIGGRNFGTPFRGFARDVWYSPLGGVNGDTLAATINGSAKTLVQCARTDNFFIDTAL